MTTNGADEWAGMDLSVRRGNDHDPSWFKGLGAGQDSLTSHLTPSSVFSSTVGTPSAYKRWRASPSSLGTGSCSRDVVCNTSPKVCRSSMTPRPVAALPRCSPTSPPRQLN
jgi:hypothetical protein